MTVDVTYDVGSRVEPPGKTGFAHLFEHLMFEGSENVGKGDHFRFVAEAGGSMNGTTSEDRTNYYETMPAESLDLALFLEADRMRALVLTQEKLDNQREAVKEEKRLRVDNQPYAPSFETADALAYDAFPYKHPVIGSMDDLQAASLDDARDFYRRYYAPANALLAVVGDVEPADAFRRVKNAFEDVSPREAPAALRVHGARPFRRAAPASGRRPRGDAGAARQLQGAGTAPSRSLRALGRGTRSSERVRSGRLWRRLVKDDSLALSLSVSLDERRGPSLFRIFSLARPGVTLERLEAEILGDLSRFAADGPTPREMERARRLLLSSAVRATQTTQSIAFLLSEYGLYDGDPGLFPHDVEAVLALDAAAVRDAAARLLVAPRRSVVTVVPSEPGESRDAA